MQIQSKTYTLYKIRKKGYIINTATFYKSNSKYLHFIYQNSNYYYKMLSNFLYDPQNLSLLMESQVKFKPELNLNKVLILKQRDVIVQILYMVSGLQTQLFKKRLADNNFQIQQEGQQLQKSYYFQLRTDLKVNFTHLSFQAIQQCTKASLQVANLVLYLQSKTQLMYRKTQNIILKTFCEGIMSFLIKFQKQNTQILTKVQMQNGKVIWSQSQKEKMMVQESQQNQNSLNGNGNYYTLIKINKYFQSKIQFSKKLVSVLSKLLPYMSAKENSANSKNQSYIAIELLFNQFALIIDQSFLSSQDYSQLVKIFSPSLKLYIGMIRDWLLMNPYQLQVKKNSGFFIKTENINFTLSKTISYQNISMLKSRNRNNFLLKENIHLNQDFVDRFFAFESLLVDEYMPRIFQKKAKSILQLGKIIQFIYLFYNPQQRPHLIKYFAIDGQFKPIFDFIQQNSQNHKYSNNSNNTIEKQSSDTMFPKKKFKYSTIGQKLKNRKKGMMHFIQVKQENPYQMFPLTRGVFVQQQNLKESIYVPKRKKQEKQQIQNKSQLITSKQFSSNLKSQNFIYFFDKILGQTIQRVYQKVIYFFAKTHKDNLTYLRNSQSLIKINSVIFSNFNHIAVSNPSRILHSISTTLIGIKKFMLYDQGDFILEFISSVHNLFENSFSKISKSLVHSMIQQAIKSSSAKQLPQQMKDNVTFMYIKKSNDLELKHLKGWTVFSLLYKPPFPVNCIFTDKCMAQFAQVFNFILNIKKCEFYLKGIWDDFKQDGKIQTQYSLYKLRRHPFESKILAIRNNIHHFVNSVFGYVMLQIQHNWEEYTNQINLSFESNSNINQQNPSIILDQTQTSSEKKVLNPIDIIELTKQLIQNLKVQTVKNMTLSNTMLLILELLDRFMKLQRIKVQSKQFNQILFRQDLQRIDHQFLGIMDMAKTIQGIGETIQFNHQFL